MRHTRVIAVVLVGSAIALLLAQKAHAPTQTNTPSVILAGETILVDIADTPELRERGLSGRESLPEERGMLFVFPEEGLHRFWMKDMRFSIDILWISPDQRIVHIEKSVAPETYPESFGPDESARYVLEVPAGYVETLGVHEGDRVRFQ